MPRALRLCKSRVFIPLIITETNLDKVCFSIVWQLTTDNKRR